MVDTGWHVRYYVRQVYLFNSNFSVCGDSRLYQTHHEGCGHPFCLGSHLRWLGSWEFYTQKRLLIQLTFFPHCLQVLKAFSIYFKIQQKYHAFKLIENTNIKKIQIPSLTDILTVCSVCPLQVATDTCCLKMRVKVPGKHPWTRSRITSPTSTPKLMTQSRASETLSSTGNWSKYLIRRQNTVRNSLNSHVEGRKNQ